VVTRLLKKRKLKKNERENDKAYQKKIPMQPPGSVRRM
jgi:hypothetical protein